MLIPSSLKYAVFRLTSLSRRVNANSQHSGDIALNQVKLIKKGEC
ncbi:hypothetical protein MCC10091_2001 [Bifidobacterium longum subsp. longum]|nr:hypothetical protein MCC10091_2001 [Bifidobacterium longum subsp. longum]